MKSFVKELYFYFGKENIWISICLYLQIQSRSWDSASRADVKRNPVDSNRDLVYLPPFPSSCIRFYFSDGCFDESLLKDG